MEMRKCSKCGKELSVDNFSINPKSGELYKSCNVCIEYMKSYSETNKEKKKSYYEANKEKILEKNKSYYEANKEKIAEKKKSYYEANKEKIAERDKSYREANKEKIAERDKSYYVANKEKKKAYKEAKALYKTYKNSFFGEFKEGENGVLLVKCKYCNMWFSPTNSEAVCYIHKGTSLYCSDGCKKSCPTYGVRKYERGFRQNTSREVQPELRKLVLERDNWTCQKCGANKDDDITVTLHCHHIDPVKNNPIESADMDNCVTLCKACHKEAHSRKGCRYSDLASCNIKD